MKTTFSFITLLTLFSSSYAISCARKPMDVVFLMDTSKSMKTAQENDSKSRVDALKAALVAKRKMDIRVGVVTADSSFTIQHPLGSNYDGMASKMKGVIQNTATNANKGVNWSSAVSSVLGNARLGWRSNAKKMVVALTADNVGCRMPSTTQVGFAYRAIFNPMTSAGSTPGSNCRGYNWSAFNESSQVVKLIDDLIVESGKCHALQVNEKPSSSDDSSFGLLSRDDSDIIVSHTPLMHTWTGNKWMITPGYAGTTQVLQFFYNFVRVAAVPFTFVVDSFVVFSMDMNGNFDNPWTSAGEQTTELRLGKHRYRIELWKKGFYAGFLPLETFTDTLMRRHPLQSTLSTADRSVLVLDSAITEFGRNRDVIGHGSLMRSILMTAVPAENIRAVSVINGEFLGMSRDEDHLWSISEAIVCQLFNIMQSTFQSQYVNLSITWFNQNALAYKCATQWAYNKGVRIIKAAGNIPSECDSPNPYVISVGMPGGCDQNLDYVEDGSTFIKIYKGSSASAAKITGLLASQSDASSIELRLNRWSETVPDYCQQLGVDGNTWLDDFEDFNTFQNYELLTNGGMVTSGTGPTSRRFRGVVSGPF